LQYRNLLIVDDEPEILRYVARIVTRAAGEGVRLTPVADAERARALAASGEFDLILSDYRLGAIDGIEVLREGRRARPEGRRILMTGGLPPMEHDEGFQEAAVALVLEKPFGRDQLLSALGLS